jgi:TRAP-type C4-dicarboxylate transport system permease large subunit
MVLNLAIGALTPPVGGVMYIACPVLDVRIVDYLRSVLPRLAAELAVLLLLTCVPVLVTFLPDPLMGPGR